MSDIQQQVEQMLQSEEASNWLQDIGLMHRELSDREVKIGLPAREPQRSIYGVELAEEQYEIYLRGWTLECLKLPTKPNLQIQRMCSYVDTKLIENTILSEFDCTWCDAKVGDTHSRACPNGERYKQVQQLTQSGKSLPEIIPGYIEQVFPESVAARELGRLGGKVKSEAKSTTARENGKKGGRPSKQLDLEDI